jgi:hypothetical protein
MVLCHIEFFSPFLQKTFNCKVLGESEKNIIEDIESQMRKI